MAKKIVRAKRSQKDIIKFVENLPQGMIQSGKASDLVQDDTENKKGTVPIDIHAKDKDEAYLIDIMLGLNENKD